MSCEEVGDRLGIAFTLWTMTSPVLLGQRLLVVVLNV